MNHIASERTSHWVNKTAAPMKHVSAKAADDSQDSGGADWDTSDAPLDFSSKKASQPAAADARDDDDDGGSIAESGCSSSQQSRTDSPPASMAIPQNYLSHPNNSGPFHHAAGPLDRLFPHGSQKLPSFPYTVRNASCGGGGGKAGTKPVRPFKAYPKDSLTLPLGLYSLPMNFGMQTSLFDPQMFAGNEDAFLQYKRTAEAFFGAAAANGTGKIGSAGPIPVTAQPGKPVRVNRRSLSGNGVVSSTVKSRKGEVKMTPVGESSPVVMTSPAASSPVTAGSPVAAADSTGPALTGSPQSVDRSISKSPGLLVEGDDEGLDDKGKKRGRSVPDEIKDEAYWERRRKNNEAAKRSRDSRRMKEDEIALKAAFLERENLTLRMEKKQLQAEVQKMRMIVYSNAQ